MTLNEALDNYLRSLPNDERIAKSRDIREGLGISRCVLSDWRRGRTKIHHLFFDKIIDIVGEDLNAFVGK